VEYTVDTGQEALLKISAMRQAQGRTLDEGAAVTLLLRDPAVCAIYPAEANGRG
jgi:hypothetical protein